MFYNTSVVPELFKSLLKNFLRVLTKMLMPRLKFYKNLKTSTEYFDKIKGFKITDSQNIFHMILLKEIFYIKQ